MLQSWLVRSLVGKLTTQSAVDEEESGTCWWQLLLVSNLRSAELRGSLVRILADRPSCQSCWTVELIVDRKSLGARLSTFWRFMLKARLGKVFVILFQKYVRKLVLSYVIKLHLSHLTIWKIYIKVLSIVGLHRTNKYWNERSWSQTFIILSFAFKFK